MSGEADPNFNAFLDKWRARTGANDRSLAESYMRGESLDAAGYGTLPKVPGNTEIHLRVDGRGLSATAEVGAIDGMVAEWEAMLADEPADARRTVTKAAIFYAVSSNRHVDLSEVLSAVVWLASDNAEVMSALKAGGVALSCEITFNDDRRSYRTKLGVYDL